MQSANPHPSPLPFKGRGSKTFAQYNTYYSNALEKRGFEAKNG